MMYMLDIYAGMLRIFSRGEACMDLWPSGFEGRVTPSRRGGVGSGTCLRDATPPSSKSRNPYQRGLRIRQLPFLLAAAGSQESK